MSTKNAGKTQKTSDTTLSKQLSWLLRHAAIEQGLSMRVDGFVRVAEILARPDMCRFTHDDVRNVVSGNDKQRYELKDENGTQWIRASQGHTIKNLDLGLKSITNAAPYPIVQHGTYADAWNSIKVQGLSRRARNHIHFSKGKGAVSGARSDCTVFIEIDLESALSAGFEFYESANGVILCAGDSNGFLPSAYFKRVVDANGNNLLVGNDSDGSNISNASSNSSSNTNSEK